eukprot:UN13822
MFPMARIYFDFIPLQREYLLDTKQIFIVSLILFCILDNLSDNAI